MHLHTATLYVMQAASSFYSTSSLQLSTTWWDLGSLAFFRWPLCQRASSPQFRRLVELFERHTAPLFAFCFLIGLRPLTLLTMPMWSLLFSACPYRHLMMVALVLFGWRPHEALKRGLRLSPSKCQLLGINTDNPVFLPATVSTVRQCRCLLLLWR